MTISQALKQKNKLVKEIQKHYSNASNFNSVVVGSPRKYSPTDSLNTADTLTKQLVELKTKIHTANIPIYGKIFLMAELKGRVNQLKNISTQEGKITEPYSRESSEREVEIDVVKLDAMVKTTEEEIENLQNDLDTYNALTHI